jgi:hypothetical protein
MRWFTPMCLQNVFCSRCALQIICRMPRIVEVCPAQQIKTWHILILYFSTPSLLLLPTTHLIQVKQWLHWGNWLNWSLLLNCASTRIFKSSSSNAYCIVNSAPADGGPRSQAEIFRCTCLQSHILESPQTAQKSYPKFRNPRTTFKNTPPVRPNMS